MRLKQSLEKYTNLYDAGNKETSEFTMSSQCALDGFKSSTWAFTSEIFQGLNQVPSVVLEKFSILLGLTKKKNFFSLNFEETKNLMNALQPESLQEWVIDDLFLIYNSKEMFKKDKNSEIIVDWICFALEYKVFRDKLAENKRILEIVHQKIQRKIVKISKFEKEKQAVLSNLKDIKNFLYFERNSSINSGETSRITRKNRSSVDLRHCNSKTLLHSEDFPDLRINSEQLCNESQRLEQNIKIPHIAYENEHELKCCRMKYFCF